MLGEIFCYSFEDAPSWLMHLCRAPNASSIEHVACWIHSACIKIGNFLRALPLRLLLAHSFAMPQSLEEDAPGCEYSIKEASGHGGIET